MNFSGVKEVKRYRKKPVVIEAIQFFNGDGPSTITKCLNFIGENGRFIDGEDVLEIKTLEGVYFAKDGDFIIKGIKGEFYPCKPDVFFLTYEEVTS